MFVVAAVELTRKKKTSKKWAAPAQSLLRESCQNFPKRVQNRSATIHIKKTE